MGTRIATTAAALLTVITATAAFGQAYPPVPPSGDSYAPRVRPIPRVEVYPRLRVQYYRDCADWLAVENRPSGPTVVPQSRCRWVKRYY
jgi:hypothetical protein